jgi:acetyl/propionyl-CoA carboxylase alpha subunit
MQAFEVLFGRAAKGLEATGAVPDLTPEEQEVVAAAQQAARAAAGQAAHHAGGGRGRGVGRAERGGELQDSITDLQQEILAAFGEGGAGTR